jgi:isopenicillin-N epimerase
MSDAVFPLDPGVVHLNPASFGLPTVAMMAATERIRHRIERDAAAYLAGPIVTELRAEAAGVERLLAAPSGSIALVANTTEASSAVAFSLARTGRLRVAMLDTEYPAVIRAWQVAVAGGGGSVQVVRLGLPLGGGDDVLDALERQLPGEFDLLVVSLVTSATALLLPVSRLAAWASTRGARTVVDAAHGAGHVELRPSELGAAAVFGTLHKWLPVPRPVGFLWLAEDLRDVVRPAAVGIGWDDELFDRFAWRGTWDPAPALCIAPAIEQWQQWRAAGRLDRARRMADRAATRLTALGLEPTGGDTLLPPRLRAFLVPNVNPETLNDSLERAAVRTWLGSSATGVTLLRIATHVYTDEPDLDRLVEAVRALGRR